MSQPNRSRLIVWDFDGTIADTRGVILNSFADVFAERGLGPLDREAARATIGVPLAEAFARILGLDVETDRGLLIELVADYRRVFAVRAPAEATMFPGIAEVLEGSVSSGGVAAIATSRGRSSLVEMLDRFGIAGHFAHVMASEDVQHHKPHPEMVQRIYEATRIGPARTTVIGDTSFDIEMGNRAAARTVGVTWGNESAGSLDSAGPDLIVETVDELDRIVVGITDAAGGGGGPAPTPLGTFSRRR